MVRRLDFTVEEFVRVIWVSNEARAVWEPRVKSVSSMFQRLEIDAVRLGIKPATLQGITPLDLIKLTDECVHAGVVVAPLEQEGIREFYSNSSPGFDPSKPWMYRTVIGKNAADFIDAWRKKDDLIIGELLGFPSCCRKFFKKYWFDHSYRDSTYPMVIDEANADNHYHVSGPTSCNILLRWLGIRRVSHLPCRFDCEATDNIGSRMNELAMNLYPKEAAWLTEMLEWPIRYTSLHGIATITTPVFRIITGTDPFSERITIDRDGRIFPNEAATGLEFPFTRKIHMKFMRNSTLWTDSGFKTEESMNKAHDVIMQLFQHVRIANVNNVIDLGSGSGALLKRIYDYLPVQLYGIEVDRSRFDRAVDRLSGTAIILFNMNLLDYSWAAPHGLVLMSLNRLLELEDAIRKILLSKIAEKSRYLILYSYDKKELDVSWSDYFKFIHAKREDQTIAYLLRSMHEDQKDKATGFPED